MTVKYLRPNYWLAILFLLTSIVHIGPRIGLSSLEVDPAISGFMALLLAVPFLVPAVLKVTNQRVSTIGYVGMLVVVAAVAHIMGVLSLVSTGGIALLGTLYILADRFKILG